MELLEFVNYNYLNKNEELTSFLEEILTKMNKDESVKDVYKRDIRIAIGKSKGFTEYKAKYLAKTIGVSKTAIKYICETLESENKILIIKEEDITFIKPII